MFGGKRREMQVGKKGESLGKRHGKKGEKLSRKLIHCAMLIRSSLISLVLSEDPLLFFFASYSQLTFSYFFLL